MKEKKEYTRLPGRGVKGARTHARLYAGEDHLLCIYSTGYIENYKRFYYRDISAIVACKTARGRNWNIFLGVFSLLFLLLASTSGHLWTSGSLKMSGLFLLVLIINALRGPTCRAYLRTAASEEELPSLNRLKIARKAMDRLRPIIENTQGALTQEEIGERASEIQTRVPEAVRPVKRPSTDIRQVSDYNGKFHGMFFFLLLAGGALDSAAFFSNGMTLTMLEMIAGFALIITGVISVIKQHSSGMKGGLLFLTWTGLCYLFLGLVVNYFVYAFLSVRHPEARSSQWELLKIYSTLSPYDNPFLEVFYVISIAVSLAIGVFGLLLLRDHRKRCD